MGKDTRRISFDVTTSTPLSSGEQVFISGDRDVLGQWRADGFPLSRVDDNVWTGVVVLPGDSPVELKVTRGSWRTEQVDVAGAVPPNTSVAEGGDAEVKIVVREWKDRLPGPAPRITGNYRIHDAISSPRLRQDRKVIVWLPPSYELEPGRRYPVVYVQDGEQVFDPQTSTWNQDWEVDEWCTRLIGDGRLKEMIAVGIFSTDDRGIEYDPAQLGPDYAAFLVEELKPFIDSEYRTEPGRETTAVAGASMGGLIAFYMAWSRPEVFFGAACLSPAFRLNRDAFCVEMIESTRKPPDLKLYFYCGQGDPLEEELLEGTRDVIGLLLKRGFEEGKNLVSVEDALALHHEAAWATHTDEWLLYLFGK